MAGADIAGAVKDIVEAVAVVVGGGWAYQKFIRRRENYPRIEFSVDVAFIGLQGDQWLIEVTANLENKGLVRHDTKEFTFDLRCLHHGDVVKRGDGHLGERANIDRSVLKKASWMSKEWGSTFVEPGVKQRYCYVASVPREASFVLVHGRFKYKNGFHTADKLVAVPSTSIESLP